MYTICKSFEFDYGHRVWTQELDSQYSLTTLCACRFLHGHRGKVSIFLASDKLTNNMVTDFKHLNWFKKWIDETLDHKMILDISDPLVNLLLTDTTLTEGEYGIFSITSKIETSKEITEMRDGLVLVPFCPTSENLAKWFFSILSNKMSRFLKENNIYFKKISFQETPTSFAEYEPYSSQ